MKELHDDLSILGVEKDYCPLAVGVLYGAIFKKVLPTWFTGDERWDIIDAYTRIQNKFKFSPIIIPGGYSNIDDYSSININDSKIVWVLTCVSVLSFDMMLFRKAINKICEGMSTNEAIDVATEFMNLFWKDDTPHLVKLENMHPALLTCMANICAHAVHSKYSGDTV